MSAPHSVQEMVLKSNQLGGQGSTQHPTFDTWFYRSKCLVTLFLVRPILRQKCSMPLGISKTTKAYLWAWEYTFAYSSPVLWWQPLSHL